MAVKLLAINDVYNIREAKYIVDEENEKDLIPEEDKVQGTKVLVIKGSKEYRMDSNKNWVLIKGEGGGDSSLPDVSSTDNGKVLGVVNGEWDKMTAPSGEGDFFIINGTLDEEYDSQTDTYVQVFVPDKTADEVVAAMQAGKYLVATAYNANWNETYVMNCVKQQITDSVGGAYTASAYFIGEDNTKKAAAQYLYKTQYYIKFEYQHPADGGGSEPEISWAYSNETFSVPSRGFYQADIRLSTENITPSTTYTVDASIAQIEAISKIRTSSLSITLYYSNYSNIAKNYRATNYSINGNTVYFDVIETISSSNPQITLHKFSWASNNTVTRLGSYTIPIPVLPSVTASDNGKVLGVVNGAWDKMDAPGGGDGDVFVISLLHTLDYEDPDNPVDVYTSDKTDEEIVSAFGDGKNVFVHYQFQDDTNIKYLRCSHCTYEPYENEGDVYVHAVFEDICDVEENFTMQSIHITNHYLQYDCEIYDGTTEHRWEYVDKSTVAQLYSKNNITITSSGDISAQYNTYTPSIAYNQAKSYGDKLSIVVKNGSSAASAKLWAAISTRVDSNGIYFDVPYTEVISNKTVDKVRSFQWTNAAILDLGARQVSGDSFPTVTSSDNGKVLGVVNGVWNKMAAPGGLPAVTPSDYDKILTVNSSGAWDVGEKDYFSIAGWYNGVNGFDEIVGQSDELVTVPSDREIIDAILNYKDMVLFMHTGHSQPYDDTVEVLRRIGFGWETYTRNGEVYKRGWAQFQNIYDPIESAHDMYLRRHDTTFYFDTYDTSDPGSWEYLYDQYEYSLLPPTTSSDNGKVLGVVDGAWDKITAPSGLPSVNYNDNNKFLSVVNGAWAKKDPPYRVDLGSDSTGFIYESSSGNYAEGNLDSFVSLNFPFPDTITVEYDEVRYTLPRTTESIYEYPVYYGDDTYTYAPFYIFVNTDTNWHFLAPISEVGTGHSISCTLTDFAIATDEFKAAVKACGATGYNVFSPLTVIAQSQSITTVSDGTHNVGNIITTTTVDAPPKYIRVTSSGYAVNVDGVCNEEGYQGIYYDDESHDFGILYDTNESSWKLITPLPGTYTVEISCEIKTSVQPSEDFKEAAKNSFSVHNYTVIYDDGTTATLKNVEVV